MSILDLLRTRGLQPDTIRRNRRRALEKLESVGLIFVSATAVGGLGEFLANAGAVDWGRVDLGRPLDFYLWPEKVRRIFVWILFSFSGTAMVIGCRFVRRKYME